jgi:hypothetical protein
MPPVVDTENNPISVIQNLPSFIKFQNFKYTFAPNNPLYHIGTFLIRGELTDKMASTKFKFFVTVKNDTPDFETKLEDQ